MKLRQLRVLALEESEYRVYLDMSISHKTGKWSDTSQSRTVLWAVTRTAPAAATCERST